MRIACDRKGTDTSAVERMVHGNNLMICGTVISCPCILTGKLDGTFNGFCTTVGKEHLFKAAGIHQLVCCFCHRLCIVQIGHMDHLVDLSLQGIIVFFDIVTKRTYSDPGCEVKILLAFHIVKINAVTVIKHNRETIICMNDRLFCIIHNFFIIHDNTCFLHCLKLQYQYLCS